MNKVCYSEPVRKSARPDRITYVPITDTALPVISAPARKNRNSSRILGLSLAMAAVLAGSAYLGTAYYYSNRFFNGTSINGVDVSGKTAYEVEQEIAAKVEKYAIAVESRNQETQTITGDRIDYQYASDGKVLAVLKAQNPLAWIHGLFRRVDYTIPTKATYDKKLLKEELMSLECAKEENQVAPENAYVSFQNEEFTIVPETEGSELLLKEAYKALDNAINVESPSIDLTSVPDVYASAQVTSDDPLLKEALDVYNNFAKAKITYTFGNETVVVDGNTIQNWLEFDSKGQLVQDEAVFRQNAREFVASLADRYDTVGTERPFDTTSGRTVYVYGYAYGWAIDQEAETDQLMAEIRSGVKTTRDPIYYMTANDHGYNDFGSTYIE
ncbi:MAG: peptidoglycan binding domain-containing protein, partial [Blautia sp.]|nr:peptidoglycan binding domain-containing protein [Blautia sp.]